MSNLGRSDLLLRRIPARHLVHVITVACLVIGTLLIYHVVPPVPGIHPGWGRDSDHQAWILSGLALGAQSAYRIAKRIGRRRLGRNSQRISQNRISN